MSQKYYRMTKDAVMEFPMKKSRYNDNSRNYMDFMLIVAYRDYQISLYFL